MWLCTPQTLTVTLTRLGRLPDLRKIAIKTQKSGSLDRLHLTTRAAVGNELTLYKCVFKFKLYDIIFCYLTLDYYKLQYVSYLAYCIVNPYMCENS